MEEIKNEEVFSGMMTEINTKLAAIYASVKTKENKSANRETIPTVSKEEIEAIAIKYVNKAGAYFDSKHREQVDNQNKLLAAIQSVDKSIKALPTQRNVPFAPIGKTIQEPKKIAFFGFEFLRSSVIIFILSVAVFWSLVMNIKQLDNYQTLKTRLYQQTEYIMQLQKNEKEKGKKTK